MAQRRQTHEGSPLSRNHWPCANAILTPSPSEPVAEQDMNNNITQLDPDEVARKLSLDIAERNNWTDGEDFEQAEQEAGKIVAFLCEAYPEHFML